MPLVSQTTFLPNGIPDPASFTSAKEYYSTTPASMLIEDGTSPIVLHHHAGPVTVELVAPAGLDVSAVTGVPGPDPAAAAVEPSAPGRTVLFSRPSKDEGDDVAQFLSAAGAAPKGGAAFELSGAQAWVTSHALFIGSGPSGPALRVPYPKISMHALSHGNSADGGSGGSVLLSLEPSAAQLRASAALNSAMAVDSEDGHHPEDEDEDVPEGWTLTIFVAPAGAAGEGDKMEEEEEEDPVAAAAVRPEARTPEGALFTALSVCADLHPDPARAGADEDGEEGGGVAGMMMMAGMAGMTDFSGIDPDAVLPFQISVAAGAAGAAGTAGAAAAKALDVPAEMKAALEPIRLADAAADGKRTRDEQAPAQAEDQAGDRSEAKWRCVDE